MMLLFLRVPVVGCRRRCRERARPACDSRFRETRSVAWQLSKAIPLVVARAGLPTLLRSSRRRLSPNHAPTCRLRRASHRVSLSVASLTIAIFISIAHLSTRRCAGSPDRPSARRCADACGRSVASACPSLYYHSCAEPRLLSKPGRVGIRYGAVSGFRYVARCAPRS